SYSQSPTGVSMPLARDFFEVFPQLEISRNAWVLVDAIFWFAEEKKGLSREQFLNSKPDLEAFHSEVEDALYEALDRGSQIDVLQYARVSNQLIFLFASVLNEIQNGPTSRAHVAVAQRITPGDAIITFNWDTLMDRALAEVTDWRPDSGYGSQPRLVHKGTWRAPAIEPAGGPTYLKLHGSTNWLTSYRMFEKGKPRLIQTSEPSTLYTYEHTEGPYATYAGRYMEGYQPFSYGYYPPNLPDDPGRPAPNGHVYLQMRPKYPWVPEGVAPDRGLPSMPLIIPPVRQKDYGFFGELFGRLWNSAEALLERAEDIVVIGYSFPQTDHQSNSTFSKALSSRTVAPQVTVIDPSPQRIHAKFRDEFHIPEANIRVIAASFTEAFDLDSLL
ncbi:MAG: hypothetical protein ACRD24_13075, partial [Terriglobales bacterium]